MTIDKPGAFLRALNWHSLSGTSPDSFDPDCEQSERESDELPDSVLGVPRSRPAEMATTRGGTGTRWAEPFRILGACDEGYEGAVAESDDNDLGVSALRPHARFRMTGEGSDR